MATLYINKKSGINFAKNIDKDKADNKLTIRPDSKNKITKTRPPNMKRKMKDLEKLLSYEEW